MTRAFLAALLALALVSAANADDLSPNPAEMAASTVKIMVRGIAGNGSGVVIYSRQDANGQTTTLILTNAHVAVTEKATIVAAVGGRRVHLVDANRIVVERPSPLRLTMDCEPWMLDLAVYQLIGDHAPLQEIKIAPRGFDYEGDGLYSTVWAVGFPFNLWHPHMTTGHFNGLVYQDSSPFEPPPCRYLLHSAHVAPGNSGGGLFRMGPDGYELLGVPSNITIRSIQHGILGGQRTMAAWPQIAYAVPAKHIWAYLDALKLSMFWGE